MINVLIADDQSLVRTGFKMILDAEPDIEVVGEAGDGAAAVTMARTRSRIPSSPCPEGGSGVVPVPCPSSSASTRISDVEYWTRTVARASRPACFIVFVSAS